MAFTATFILLFMITTTINADKETGDIYCYHCVGFRQRGKCFVVQRYPEYLIPCPAGRDHCIKRVVRKPGYLQVERRCSGPPAEQHLKLGCTYIRYGEDEETAICFCNTDECNGSTLVRAVPIYSVLLVVIGLYLF